MKTLQLPLIEAPRGQAVLSIASVPGNVALGRDRHYIQISEGAELWRFPMQFRRDEARELQEAIAQSRYDLSLTLSESGARVPVDCEAIAALVESWIDRRGGAND